MKKITIEEDGQAARTIKVVQYGRKKNEDGTTDIEAMRQAFPDEYHEADLVFGEVTKPGGPRKVTVLKDRNDIVRQKYINIDPLRGKLVFTDRRWTRKWKKYNKILIIQDNV